MDYKSVSLVYNLSRDDYLLEFRVRIFKENLNEIKFIMLAKNIKAASKYVKELNLGKWYKIELLRN